MSVAPNKKIIFANDEKNHEKKYAVISHVSLVSWITNGASTGNLIWQ